MLTCKKYLDLTHTLSSDVPSWDGLPGFSVAITKDYQSQQDAVSFRVQELHLHAGIGTHMDAPAHCIKDGLTIEEIPIEDLVVLCSVIDVSKIAHDNFRLTEQHVKDFEKAQGRIPKRHFIIVRFGWDTYFHDANRFRNNLRFPTVSKEAGDYLLSKDIVGLGVDTLSPDSADSNFPVHHALLGAGKYIVENVANSHALSPLSRVMIFPLKFKGATEAPVRMIAELMHGVQ